MSFPGQEKGLQTSFQVDKQPANILRTFSEHGSRPQIRYAANILLPFCCLFGFSPVLCLKSGTSRYMYNNIIVMEFYLLTLIYLLNIHKFMIYLLNIHKFISSIKFKIFRVHFCMPSAFEFKMVSVSWYHHKNSLLHKATFVTGIRQFQIKCLSHIFPHTGVYKAIDSHLKTFRQIFSEWYPELFFYAPNFGEVEGAYWFGPVCPSVCP